MNPEQEYYQALAADLDRLADVPDDVLLEIVTRDCPCTWSMADDVPVRQDEELTDRELAARLCAECPARRACLELELRTAGPDTAGVWGGLSDEDRRALYPVWLARRGRKGGQSS